MKNIIGIVQARTGSKRLPGKVLKKIGKYSLIELLFKRLSKSKKLSKIVLATTKNKNDDYLTSLVSKLGYEVYRGSEDDVLSRYFKVAKKNSAKYIVRITGDCPLVDSKIVDDIVNKTYENVSIELNENYDLNEIEECLKIGGNTKIRLIVPKENKKLVYSLEKMRKFDLSVFNNIKNMEFIKKITF